MTNSLSAVLLVGLFFLSSKILAYAPHKINRWPGQPSSPNFGQYGGHITINATSGKNFYYLFVESPKEPEKKPLVLWLNGGPGCSSVFNGFFGEHGPWRVNDIKGKTLAYNPNSWHSEANVIYLESPVGVGFSYSETLDDYTTDDLKTAKDNYVFILRWLEKYPRYKNRPFFITGESYAGHYIPQLSVEIIKGNVAAAKKKLPVVQLQGIMIGNPYFRGDKDVSFVEALYNRYAVSQTTFDNFNKFCRENRDMKKCDETYSTMFSELGDIDIYDLYSPVCQYKLNGVLSIPANSKGTKNRKFLGTFQKADSDSTLPAQTPTKDTKLYLPLRKTNFHKFMRSLEILDGLKQKQYESMAATSAASTMKASSVSTSGLPKPSPEPFSLSNPACLDHWTVEYMNKPEVQKAINANMSRAYYETIYLPCSYVLSYTMMPSALYTFDTLFKSSLRIWIYSGDTDTIVPFSMTRKDLKTLNRPLKTKLYPWYFYDQPAGWSEVYDRMTVLTVRGAGHLVPKSVPETALFLLRIFLEGVPPPAVPFP